MTSYQDGIRKIAEHMKISIAEAEDFFHQVQNCFRGYKSGEPKPKDPNDIYFVISSYQRNLTPVEVYKVMAQNTRPALDHERVASDEVKRCPHGNLVTQPCASCDKENFKFMTGID